MRNSTFSQHLPNPHFNRLEGARRNKKLRNIALSTGGVSGLLALILALDPLMSGEQLMALPFFFFALVFFVSTGLSLYFHLRFIARD